MKKTILMAFAAIFTMNVWGQWSDPDANGKIYYNGGNVGIGRSTPGTPLEIRNSNSSLPILGSSSNSQFRITSNNNAVEIGVTNTWNGRTAAIQVRHESNNYSDVFGKLLLNPLGGNVGIGTTTPNAKLHINEGYLMVTNSILGEPSEQIRLGRKDSPGIRYHSINTSHSVTQKDNYIQFAIHSGEMNSPYTNQINVLTMNGEGYVGIGTTAPDRSLVIDGANADNLVIKRNGGTDNNNAVKFENNGSNIYVGASHNNDFAIGFSPNLGGTAKFILKENGNVGIGTTDPNYKLSVKGTIGCGEIIVEDVTTWADFVFEENYNLMSLQELDNFIQENKHLPEIPTTEEVEENGISVGEMNAKLLQKIEELTLYLIEKDKEINELRNDMKELKEKIN